MSIFRKAYSVVGALLMLEFFAQLYFIAAAMFTIVNSNDNAKDVYAAFKNADGFAGLHAANGWIIGIIILVWFGLSFGAQFPRRTIILNAVMLVLYIIQFVLAHTGTAVLAGLHGLNALIMIGLGGYLTGRNWAFGSRADATPARP